MWCDTVFFISELVPMLVSIKCVYRIFVWNLCVDVFYLEWKIIFRRKLNIWSFCHTWNSFRQFSFSINIYRLIKKFLFVFIFTDFDNYYSRQTKVFVSCTTTRWFFIIWHDWLNNRINDLIDLMIICCFHNKI